MANNIIWYHSDWAQPSVMKDAPHPEDWGIAHWSFAQMTEFIEGRNRELRYLIADLRNNKVWAACKSHAEPIRSAFDASIHASVMDREQCGLAILSSRCLLVANTEVVVVVPPSRLHRYCPRHIVRKVQFIGPEWAERMYRLVWEHRRRGDTLAFTVPVIKGDDHDSESPVHDFQRSLIRAMGVWLQASDSTETRSRVA